MSRSATLRLSIDADRVSPSRMLAETARTGPLIIVTHNALRDLSDELGGYEAALRHVARVATNTGKPLGINLPAADDNSTTVFIPPKGWTAERLAGWVAGHHEVLEQAFGPATVRRES